MLYFGPLILKYVEKEKSQSWSDLSSTSLSSGFPWSSRRHWSERGYWSSWRSRIPWSVCPTLTESPDKKVVFVVFLKIFWLFVYMNTTSVSFVFFRTKGWPWTSWCKWSYRRSWRCWTAWCVNARNYCTITVNISSRNIICCYNDYFSVHYRLDGTKFLVYSS